MRHSNAQETWTTMETCVPYFGLLTMLEIRIIWIRRLASSASSSPPPPQGMRTGMRFHRNNIEDSVYTLSKK